MTTQETIDQAARVIREREQCKYDEGSSPVFIGGAACRDIAQALADAGLLARADRRTYRNPPPGMVPADYYTPAEALELLAERDAKIERAEERVRELEATIQRVRDQLALAQNVPVHVGGGNLVSRRWMVTADAIRAALDQGDQS